VLERLVDRREEHQVQAMRRRRHMLEVRKQPARFEQAWDRADIGVDTRRPLASIYSEPVITELRDGLGRMQRWGITEGQGTLVGATLGELPVPKAISALASGQVDADEAAQQAADDVTSIQDSLG
jgi:multiple sugar transport system substrate-binding protein